MNQALYAHMNNKRKMKKNKKERKLGKEIAKTVVGKKVRKKN
jgi:hypothetical protein